MRICSKLMIIFAVSVVSFYGRASFAQQTELVLKKDWSCIQSNVSNYLKSSRNDTVIIFAHLCPEVEPAPKDIATAATNSFSDLPKIPTAGDAPRTASAILVLSKKVLSCLTNDPKRVTEKEFKGEKFVELDIKGCSEDPDQKP